MNCTEFRDSLRSSVELRQEPSSEAAMHAAMCSDAECRSLGEESRWLDAAIVRWKAAAPVVDLADDVLRQLTGDSVAVPPATVLQIRSRRESARTAWWSTACAACAMVALTTLLLSRRGHDDLAAQLAARARAGQTVAPEGALSAGKIGRQYVAIAEGAGSLVADAVGAVLPGVSSDDHEPQTPQWKSEWLRRLEPAQRQIDQVLMELQSMTGPAS